jgi:hypothetical protein
MTIREEIKRERKKFLATATPKEKWSYFWDYYGLWTTISIIIIAFFTYIVIDTITKPTIILNGAFVNLTADNSLKANALGDEFLKAENFDIEEYGVSFGAGITIIPDNTSASYESSQALMTQAAGGALDFIAGPNSVLLDYAYGGLFVDLRTVMSEDEIEQLKPYLHYIDEAVIDLRNEREDNFESYDDIKLPDSKNPEEMECPVPVFVDMEGNKKMSSVYGNTRGLIIGVSVKAPNPENTVKFFKFLCE